LLQSSYQFIHYKSSFYFANKDIKKETERQPHGCRTASFSALDLI